MLKRSPLLVLLLVSWPSAARPGSVVAQSPGETSMPIEEVLVDSLSLTPQQARSSVQWLAAVALKKLPRTLDGDRDWGDTKRVWSGVRVKRDGWKLKTHRRYREVEHGRWIRYAVTLPDPNAGNAPAVVIHQAIPVDDPLSGDQRWRIDSTISAVMKFKARIQRWNLGARIYSLTVSGEMQVRLATSASMGFFADYGEVPPALVIDPKVERAHLELERFEVNRVSHIGGDAAEHWGDLMEEILVERLVRKQNDKLVPKLNRAIEKERDDLRFSLAQWFEQW